MSNQVTNSSNEINSQNNHNDEISLSDVIEFFRSSWKLIISMGLIGLVIGIFFLFFAPKQYEAVGQIQMSQLGPKGGGRDILNPDGVNVEDPVLLIARFKLPSTYTSAEIEACGLKNQDDGSYESLAEVVKISPLKPTTTVVELKIKKSSPGLAKSCLEAIFERIKQTQEAIKEPYLIKARMKIVSSVSKQSSAKLILDRADKSGSALSAIYLSTRDEVKALQDEISILEGFIAYGEMHRTKLISPIYVSERPVSPKRKITIVFSLLAGLFVGILVAFIIKYKIQLSQKNRVNPK